MPELPEVETVRRSLEGRLVGARVIAVEVCRADVCVAPRGLSLSPRALLAGTTIERLDRRGKQLAIISREGPALCIHLGMSGQLFLAPGARRLPRDHVHVRWRLATLQGELVLAFRDPRRFGGVWSFRSFDELVRTRWASLGPDGVGLSAAHLRLVLAGTRRTLKAVLLDQRAVAGVGNIYADEALYRAGLAPARAACTLNRSEGSRLARAVREVLRLGIRRRGASVRDFVDADRRRGASQDHFKVYGRSRARCLGCLAPLRSQFVAQRTTVWCPVCQH